jgi:hypothetical protein
MAPSGAEHVRQGQIEIPCHFIAEEKGFEPLVPCGTAVFKLDQLSEQGCTEQNTREIEAVETKDSAPRGTERHRDHGPDQARDHRTKLAGPNLAEVAGALLKAVAEGDANASLALASELAAAVLDAPIFTKAGELQRLLGDRSPFALVRAVELARTVLHVDGRSQKGTGNLGV